ncbi:nucleoside deaminase [Gilvimarinus agarilyticus]|uniref:nucleoside deaminase n=1 Tax=Gilvimarinus sp. 2_MG-2023 TaxID=3062666 RepID=UPI001C088FAE|nr:nucleoside deaminase [Gilvimarinus sp. 2_MG-2023]MBU2886309.1 nucleoside deaminase [Gilvimarinus agarilyticus]MDO6570995.1 nucleoside deaminase [Gilvimarinus sp. 2_MG-2023]
MNCPHTQFLQECLQLASDSAASGGGPFAALVVKNNTVIARACNTVTTGLDPTAHAEVNAIRAACQTLQSHQLTDCIIYSSCEPCPMCLGAIYWARPTAVYFAADHKQAAAAGFDDSFIYRQIKKDGADRTIPFHHVDLSQSERPFSRWQQNSQRTDY